MTFKKIEQAKLSDVIVAQLERLILEGSLKPGDKLPSERDLALEFEVSRPSLRDAISNLESKGILMRRQGGGTYVGNQLWQSVADPLVTLLANHDEAQYDLLEFRHAIEGMTAYYAALRGTAADYEKLQQSLAAIEQQQDNLALQAKSIVAFYEVIAEASHNVVMLHLVLSLTDLIEQNVLDNLMLLQRQPATAEVIRSHRSQLVQCIIAQNPEAARKSSNQHLSYIEEMTLLIRQVDSRQQRSLRRLREPK